MDGRLQCPGPSRCLYRAWIIGGALIGLSGCGSLGGAFDSGAAQVRFVALAPTAPDLDLYINGTGAAYGLGFESFTSYLPVIAGATNVAAHPAGRSHAVSARDVVFGEGRHYTVLLRQTEHVPGGVEQYVVEDQDKPAPAGHMALRILDEVTDVSSLSVFVTPLTGQAGRNAGTVPSPALVLRPSAHGVTRYVDLPAEGAYAISATLPETRVRRPLSTVTLHGVSGAVRTVVFGGAVGRDEKIGEIVSFVLPDADLP